MNKKLYDLMNWPEIEGIVYSESDNPQTLLGGRVCKEGFLVQAFRPDAVEMQVRVEGRTKVYPMEKVDEAGYFAALIPYKKRMRYTLTAENLQGKKVCYKDPYAYGMQLKRTDINKWMSGVCKDAYRFMGSHEMVVDGEQGMHFAVWAPNARRVSIVGAFNGWDGRLLQMMKDAESGIFELFVPGMEAGTAYNYEIKLRDGRIQLKADPYCRMAECGRQYASAADAETDYVWKDAKWFQDRKKADAKAQPMAICELDMEAMLDAEIVSKVADMGFHYVELMSVCAAAEETAQEETLSYFAPQQILGSEKLKALVDAFHQQGIGVLMDWNAAYMGRHLNGLTYFDGTALYETNATHLSQQPDLAVATFDYAKPQVCSYLYSSFVYWVEQYHMDGVRIDEVASMLYLDYGRNAGEWVPNMYGGNENLAAIEFLKTLRKIANQCSHTPLLIAEENSAWPQVTGDVKKNGLGFDYKWNDGWNKEFIPFMELDPLFRKGSYGRLTYSMLYQYSENFILALSHKGFHGNRACLVDRMPSGAQEEAQAAQDKQCNVRAALAFMYTHPGRKLLNIHECFGFEKYIADLNALYTKHAAMYELDDMPDGFEWVDDISAQETVFAYVRRAADGTQLLAAVNFTPVMRPNFRLGVAQHGKYKMIFNSELPAYGGKSALTEKAVGSEEIEWNGRANSIEVTLPPMGAVVYTYTPYTEIELEEIRIKQEAARAKAKAVAEAEEAEALRVKAEEQARLAQEAEERAKAAAKEAMEAKLAAEKKAKLAVQTSLKIDEEMKKKLEALKRKQKGDN